MSSVRLAPPRPRVIAVVAESIDGSIVLPDSIVAAADRAVTLLGA